MLSFPRRGDKKWCENNMPSLNQVRRTNRASLSSYGAIGRQCRGPGRAPTVVALSAVAGSKINRNLGLQRGASSGIWSASRPNTRTPLTDDLLRTMGRNLTKPAEQLQKGRKLMENDPPVALQFAPSCAWGVVFMFHAFAPAQLGCLTQCVFPWFFTSGTACSRV